MKPAPFAYTAPETVDEAVALLARHGAGARVLAGGQSLVPEMNFRQATPAVLIDINGIGGLDRLDATDDGGLRVGALVRQSTLEDSAVVRERFELLAEALPRVAYRQVRNRGTFCGSLAQAERHGELPTVAVALGARLRAVSQRGERWIDASDFFLGALQTALAPDELLVEAVLPGLESGSGSAFLEVARRACGTAAVAVAAVWQPSTGPRVAIAGAGERPIAVDCSGLGAPSPEAFAALGHRAADSVTPYDDVHGSPGYRRRLVRVLVPRALSLAHDRSGASS